ncbi:TetR/AcrR family transcriptional regulator [Mesorhizobium sp. WSM4307]|uniref:TetR/AcrR family transcriptional regulator n=1 Tax=unclassified Mesorhizobium TaxID=325217 RepID=UPI00115EF325|nr:MULTISPECIES: TetR/AcrR family transcriptional regulator [unclassified Mesorhizobium]TRC77381.1 TetR/AcrR family transcriptional regulator [Mesorhizobium sp. WSM4315]TRC80022.1 TetR/AcrR family transcriptional regulator [Mesorhizobium sp. WSM4307]
MRYDKGRKDASRSRIMEVAANRFRGDGIAASGLATIMKDAGLTNGAFYPHFQSKADLVRESMASALETQSQQLQQALALGGLELAMAMYLSPEHRDHPPTGCASAALLPEIARQSPETRALYTEKLLTLVHQLAKDLPPRTRDREGVALGVFAALIGTLQLARAVEGTDLSDRILAAGADAARALIQPRQKHEAS